MLTLPAEPRPQTSLIDPLPVAPSFVSYGVSGSRRSPRKNHITDRRAAQKPYGKLPSLTRKPRPNTVQMEHSVSSRLERTPGRETSNKEPLNSSVAPESVQEKLQRPPISPRISSQNQTLPCRGASTSDPSDPMETRSLLVPDSAPKGWVIGPLFQSFRSKMASFSEIVMSPVKLFKSNSTESEPATEPNENTEESTGTTVERRDQPTGSPEKSSPRCVLSFEEEEADILKVVSDDIVPWQSPKTQLETTVDQSALNSSEITTTAPATAVCTSKTAHAPETEANTETFGVENAECGAVLTKMDSEIDPESDYAFTAHLDENKADQTPTSRSILDDAGLKKVKRTLDLSEETGKRKKVESVAKRKLKRKDETPIRVTKAVTRADKRSRVQQELSVDKGFTLVTLEEINCDQTCSLKAKARTLKRAKAKASPILDPTVSENPTVTAPPLDTTENVSVVSKKRKSREEVKEESSAVTVHKEKCGKTERKTKKTKVLTKDAAKDGSAAENVYSELTPSETEARDWSVQIVNEGGVANEGMSNDAEADEAEANETVANGAVANDAVAKEGGVIVRRTRRSDAQRRKCRVFKLCKVNEPVTAATHFDPMFKQGSSTRLLRSQSCPEIPWLRPMDTPWTPHFHSPPRSRSQPPQQHAGPLSLSSSSLGQHFQRSPRRTRRHTVCSVEVEREIAPLCLRKEVYPARRSPSPYDSHSPMRALSPGASLSALASGFLSSPLAFLSKGPQSSPLRSLPSSSSPSLPSLSSLLGTSLGQLPGFHLRTDTLLNASCDPGLSGASILLCPPEVSPPEEDEDTSSSSPESEELREESAHSDSDIKVQASQGQRKVSSIKIRKALPKPQNNLTPMGLPKAVRVKKKEFSLEEIYTNKNFSKPPESRLETIFEVPLSRRNGAVAWCGQKRLKRAMLFPELGEARRPKKPLVGAAKANAANSRKRRGGTKEDPAIGSDPDSLLCAKLEQLTAWLALDCS